MSTKVQIGIELLVVAMVGLPLAAKLKYRSAGQAATGSGGIRRKQGLFCTCYIMSKRAGRLLKENGYLYK